MDTNTPHSHAERGNETHGHGDDTSGYVNPEALHRGHEEDKVDIKSILYVPLALVATFVLAYVVVTLIINSVRAPSTEKPDNPKRAKLNEAPINDRFARIDSSDPKAEEKQPRLEGMQQVEGADLPYWRSMLPTKEGNPRWFHPEDMRITSAYAKELGLQDYAWVDEEKKVVRVPVETALKLVLSAKDPKNAGVDYLAASKEPIPRDNLKDGSKPSNPQLPTTFGVVPKEEKNHKDDKNHKDEKKH